MPIKYFFKFVKPILWTAVFVLAFQQSAIRAADDANSLIDKNCLRNISVVKSEITMEAPARDAMDKFKADEKTSLGIKADNQNLIRTAVSFLGKTIDLGNVFYFGNPIFYKGDSYYKDYKEGKIVPPFDLKYTITSANAGKTFQQSVSTAADNTAWQACINSYKVSHGYVDDCAKSSATVDNYEDCVSENHNIYNKAQVSCGPKPSGIITPAKIISITCASPSATVTVHITKPKPKVTIIRINGKNVNTKNEKGENILNPEIKLDAEGNYQMDSNKDFFEVKVQLPKNQQEYSLSFPDLADNSILYLQIPGEGIGGTQISEEFSSALAQIKGKQAFTTDQVRKLKTNDDGAQTLRLFPYKAEKRTCDPNIAEDKTELEAAGQYNNSTGRSAHCFTKTPTAIGKSKIKIVSLDDQENGESEKAFNFNEKAEIFFSRACVSSDIKIWNQMASLLKPITSKTNWFSNFIGKILKPKKQITKETINNDIMTVCRDLKKNNRAFIPDTAVKNDKNYNEIIAYEGDAIETQVSANLPKSPTKTNVYYVPYPAAEIYPSKALADERQTALITMGYKDARVAPQKSPEGAEIWYVYYTAYVATPSSAQDWTDKQLMANFADCNNKYAHCLADFINRIDEFKEWSGGKEAEKNPKEFLNYLKRFGYKTVSQCATEYQQCMNATVPTRTPEQEAIYQKYMNALPSTPESPNETIQRLLKYINEIMSTQGKGKIGSILSVFLVAQKESEPATIVDSDALSINYIPIPGSSGASASKLSLEGINSPHNKTESQKAKNNDKLYFTVTYKNENIAMPQAFENALTKNVLAPAAELKNIDFFVGAKDDAFPLIEEWGVWDDGGELVKTDYRTLFKRHYDKIKIDETKEIKFWVKLKKGAKSDIKFLGFFSAIGNENMKKIAYEKTNDGKIKYLEVNLAELNIWDKIKSAITGLFKK